MFYGFKTQRFCLAASIPSELARKWLIKVYSTNCAHLMINNALEFLIINNINSDGDGVVRCKNIGI